MWFLLSFPAVMVTQKNHSVLVTTLENMSQDFLNFDIKEKYYKQYRFEPAIPLVL